MDWSNAIGGAVGAIGNIFSSIRASKNTKRMIAAQKEMNERNIQAQQDINNQNIAFQRDVNSIMRSDAHNAVGIKKRDLQNSGYSTADPNFSGASAASLGTPNLSAPVVQSEFTPDMARQQFEADMSLSNSILQGASIASQIALQKAQAREHNSNATGIDINNSWLNAQNKANYESVLQSIENMRKQGNLTDKQADKVTSEISQIQSNIGLLSENIKMAKLNNQYRPIEFQNAMNQCLATISNLNADTSKKNAEKILTSLSSDLKRIEVRFARMGINFNSSNIVEALARVVLSGNGKMVVGTAVQFVKDSFGGLLDSIFPSSPLGDKFRKMASNPAKSAFEVWKNMLFSSPWSLYQSLKKYSGK